MADQPPGPADVAAVLDQLDPIGLAAFHGEMRRRAWDMQAHPYQQPGDGQTTWAVHLLQAGRGAGKTRSAAEWMLIRRLIYPGTRGGILAPKFRHAWQTCLRGKSGILTLADEAGIEYTANRNDRVVTFTNGSTIEWFSSEQPEDVRGPEFHDFWIDEPASLWEGEQCYSNVRGAVRLDGIDGPKLYVTGTPKPVPIIRKITEGVRTSPGTFTISRAITMDNEANLAPEFIAALREEYEGTRFWEQEVLGHLIEEAAGALWKSEWFRRDGFRVTLEQAGALDTIAIGLDPADSYKGDEVGILVGARGKSGRGYLLADETLRGSMLTWTQTLGRISREHGARVWIVEKSLGASMRETLDAAAAEAGVPIQIKYVTPVGSKASRAEPVARMYEQGKISHVVDAPGGSLEQVEAEYTTWEPADAKSPGRIDASAHLFTHLMVQRRSAGGFRASDLLSA